MAQSTWINQSWAKSQTAALVYCVTQTDCVSISLLILIVSVPALVGCVPSHVTTPMLD